MKKHNIILLLSFFVFIVFTSCTEDPRQVQYIPEGTASVIHVKSKDLIKANLKGKETASRILKGFRGYGIYNETFDMAMSALFEDSLKTGINKESNLMAYLILSEEFRNAFRCTSLMLDDSTAFSRYLKEVKSGNYEILQGTKNSICYINKNDRFSWIAYNDEVVVFGSSTIHTKGIVECVNKIFSHSRKTLARNNDFMDFYNHNYEYGIWIATSEMLQCYYMWYKELPSFLSFKNIPESVKKGNYLHAYISFDKAAKMTLQFTPSRDFKKFWRKNNFMKHTFDPKICNWLPQNTLWFMTFALEPQNFIKMFGGSDQYEYAVKELQKLNVSMGDLANAFDGNCAFSLYDVTLEKNRTFEFVQDYNYEMGTFLWNHLQKEQKTTFPHLAVALGLKDAKLPTMVLDHISSEVCEKKGSGVYCFSNIMGFPAYVICRDNALLLTTDKNYVDSVVAKAESHLSLKYGEKIEQLGIKATDYTSYHYMNFDVESYPQTMKDYLSKMNVLPLVVSYSKIVKSAKMTINDSYSGTIDIEFQDTTKNSLENMNKLLQIIIP